MSPWIRAGVLLSLLLGAGRAEAQPAPEEEEGDFLDDWGEWHPFDETYEEWFGEATRHPRVLRAALEDAAVMALGVGHYWVQRHANKADWDEPSPADRITLRAVRFDNNLFSTNNLLHPLAGAAYYGLPRVNGFDPLEALAAVTIASTVWEFALEWREKVSINDMIVTPIGGMALGEFLYQLGQYLTSAPQGGVPQDVAAWTLGFPQRIHDVVDGRPSRRPLPPDRLGFSTAFWHRFKLGTGPALHRNDVDRMAMGAHFFADGELVSVPGFLRPGAFRLLFSEGNFVRFRLHLDLVEGTLEDFDLFAQTQVAGYYEQRIDVAPGHAPEGYGILLALGAAVQDSDRALLGRRDELAIARFLELASRLWLTTGGLVLRIDAELGADFASVRSLALSTWAISEGMHGIKTVLAQQGYYFALGYSMRLGVRVEYEGFDAGARLSYGDYESIEGLDRLQHEVTRDVGAEDEVVACGAWVGIVLGDSPVRAELAADEVLRWSRLQDERAHRWDRRLVATIGLGF